MSASLRHNGCDTLMLGFDYELRRRGFAGNSCPIVLELSAAVDPVRLEHRLAELAGRHPILRSRPARGLKPRWKPTRAMPRVRVHERKAGLAQRLFNEPLDIHRGELIRFRAALPVSLATRRQPVAGTMNYQVIALSPAEGTLRDGEAAEFNRRLRQRLLNP
jgi:hypothetical protein